MSTTASGTSQDDGPLRERGSEVTRLEAFVDAAFAFAVTMLVISFDSLPDSIGALIEALKGIPAFAASFAVIANFWHLHARWSRRYGLDDSATTGLSLLLVFLVMVYVYPLQMIFGGLFNWISGGALPAGFTLSSFDDLRWMFLIYAIAWATLGLVMVALNRHAWKQRESLDLNRSERLELRGNLARAWLIPITGGLSGLTALLMPESNSYFWPALPGFCYVLMSFSGRIGRLAQARYAQREDARA